jgi:cysteine desulfurase
MSLQNAIGHNGNGNGHNGNGAGGNGAVPGMNSTGVVITHSTTPLPEGVHLPLYMDNHATTPLDPRVLDAMMPYFTGKFGNAASRNHQFGWEAEKAVEIAREQIAKLIGASAKEIIFTSGATESNNLALKGIAEMYRERGNHIITQVTEHKAVLDTCKKLEKQGYRITYLPVMADGLIDLDDLRRAIVTEGTEKTILVSIMYANNEIGVVQPIREIGKICHEKGVLFHTDAVQAVGKIPVNVQADNIDVLSISAHKLYGPKGVGALYVRRRNPRVQITEQINGGGHERGMRSGTLNVPGIVGLGAACEICMNEMADEAVRERELRDHLRAKLEAALDYVQVNGNMEHHLPGNLNMSFVYVEGESLLMGINDIAVSSGSACTSATLEPSYVLKALGLGDEIAHSSIRFGLGRFNTRAEVDYVADKIIDVVRKLRELSPLYEMVQEGIDLTKIEWAAH